MKYSITLTTDKNIQKVINMLSTENYFLKHINVPMPNSDPIKVNREKSKVTIATATVNMYVSKNKVTLEFGDIDYLLDLPPALMAVLVLALRVDKKIDLRVNKKEITKELLAEIASNLLDVYSRYAGVDVADFDKKEHNTISLMFEGLHYNNQTKSYTEKEVIYHYLPGVFYTITKSTIICTFFNPNSISLTDFVTINLEEGSAEEEFKNLITTLIQLDKIEFR